MEQLSVLDPNRVSELTVTKAGWLNPIYTLTDGINIYGSLSYGWDWRRTGKLETAQQTWLIEPQRLFRRNIIVKEPSTGQIITIIKRNLWRGEVNLEFPDGRILVFKRQGFFSRTHSWYSEQYGNILNIVSGLNSLKQPFKVMSEPNMSPTSFNLTLIAFIGVHLILLQRSHAMAH